MAEAVSAVRAVHLGMSLSPDGLAATSEIVRRLAARPELWEPKCFPIPEGKMWEAYLLHEDQDGTYAMYAVAMHPGHSQPPHNHGTWAVIAGIVGNEQSTLFERTDDHTCAGRATLHATREVNVTTGQAIALGPDDIHSIRIDGPGDALHLHLYGKGFSHLRDRLLFDLESGTCSIFPIISNISEIPA